MRTLPVTDAKTRLSELVDSVNSTHDVVTITRHGYPAAVLMSADEFESLNETLAWAAQPGIDADLSEARSDIAAGRTTSVAEARRQLESTRHAR